MPAIKRELTIVKDLTMYRIIYSGGGQVPAYMEGLFTTYVVARDRMHTYGLMRKAEAEETKRKNALAARKAKAKVETQEAAAV